MRRPSTERSRQHQDIQQPPQTVAARSKQFVDHPCSYGFYSQQTWHWVVVERTRDPQCTFLGNNSLDAPETLLDLRACVFLGDAGGIPRKNPGSPLRLGFRRFVPAQWIIKI